MGHFYPRRGAGGAPSPATGIGNGGVAQAAAGYLYRVYLKQFYLAGLGHASYLLGSERTGEALVFDPRRDVRPYLRRARQEQLRVRYVMDSHGHNDYLSGLSALAEVAGAQVLGSAAAALGYPHRPVRDREQFEFGEVGVEVRHTPGHTPEHVALLVYDRSVSADQPALLLSGGALLVGDLARPDLLGGPEQAREAARSFFTTVRDTLLALPDQVEVFPTHVSGSLCGGSIGSRLSTTVGYERATNPLLKASTVDDFVDRFLHPDELPAVPPYWRRMRAQNLAGVAPLGVLAEPPALPPPEFARAREAEQVVLDVRSPEAFGGGHIPGALNVAADGAFATWAGTLVPEDARVLLVSDQPAAVWPVTWDLLRIGYPVPAGWLAGGMTAWRTAGQPLARLPQVTVQELRGLLATREADLLDVRQPAEWAAGHVPGARFITGAQLPARLDEVAAGRPLAIMCSSGFRSSAAASLLAQRGLPVLNVLGGMGAWRSAGYPQQSGSG